eukprot:scaffold14306_cov80-Isochrysis_galbana.AAC.6
MSRATLDWASGCAATSNPSTPLATSCPRSARRALSTKRGSPMASSGVPQKAASSVAETPGPISARVSGQQACLRSLRAAATSWSKAPGEMRCLRGGGGWGVSRLGGAGLCNARAGLGLALSPGGEAPCGRVGLRGGTNSGWANSGSPSGKAPNRLALVKVAQRDGARRVEGG